MRMKLELRKWLAIIIRMYMNINNYNPNKKVLIKNTDVAMKKTFLMHFK